MLVRATFRVDIKTCSWPGVRSQKAAILQWIRGILNGAKSKEKTIEAEFCCSPNRLVKPLWEEILKW